MREPRGHHLPPVTGGLRLRQHPVPPQVTAAGCKFIAEEAPQDTDVLGLLRGLESCLLLNPREAPHHLLGRLQALGETHKAASFGARSAHPSGGFPARAAPCSSTPVPGAESSEPGQQTRADRGGACTSPCRDA